MLKLRINLEVVLHRASVRGILNVLVGLGEFCMQGSVVGNFHCRGQVRGILDVGVGLGGFPM